MFLLKRFILMIQFLTTIPIRVQLDATEKDFGNGLVFAPVVGLLIGGFITGVYYISSFLFPPSVVAMFVLIAYIVLTGGLHLDGLGDTFDGIFSNRPKERILEIMRDSRVGTNAVLAILSVILLNWVMISNIDEKYTIISLILMPVAGRIGSLVSAGVSNYARSGQGLGKSFIDYCGYREIACGAILSSIIFFTVAGVERMFLLPLPFISAFITVRFFSKKIGGATGDVLGAVCELNQTIFLVVMCTM